MYEKMYRVLQSGDTFTFTFRRPQNEKLASPMRENCSSDTLLVAEIFRMPTERMLS